MNINEIQAMIEGLHSASHGVSQRIDDLISYVDSTKKLAEKVARTEDVSRDVREAAGGYVKRYRELSRKLKEIYDEH